jgi:TPR repeat protein
MNDLSTWRVAAAQGNPAAQYNMGIAYSNGDGVPKSTAIAFRYFYYSAKGGDNEAAEVLRMLGDEPAWAERTQLMDASSQGFLRGALRRRAERGDADAQFRVGLGDMKAGNYEAGFYWILQAAEQGRADAQAVLGSAYEFGRGIDQDGEAAVAWYLKAGQQGHPDAQYNLGTAYEHGRGGFAQDYKAAASWYRKAALQGDADAQAALGGMYAKGQGIDQDYEAAVVWWAKAAENGRVDSQYNLGVACERGTGVAQDYETALTWYRMAAAQGNPDALARLLQLGETDSED